MIIKKDKNEIESYFTDESGYKGFCDAVYFPENEVEIIDLLKKCNSSKTKVTIAGNGTGLASGRVPEGGIVISLEKLNKILELNTDEKYVILQPAVILGELQKHVEANNLFYPPDPTERNCFVGATVVTNSSGARTFKYGPTRDYVLGLKIILPTGDTFSIKRGEYFSSDYKFELVTDSGNKTCINIPQYEMPSTKNAAGYYCKKNMDLIDLFIGSEGTLGILTEIKLKLIDLPKNILSCVVFFPKEKDALDFITEARNLSRSSMNTNKIDARGLEFFDYYSLRTLSDSYPNIPAEAWGAVWFEQEINENEDEIISAWTELINKYNGMEEESWFAVDNKEQEKFKEFRHSIAWKVNEIISQRGLKKIGTDIAVPHEVFEKYYNDIKALIVKNGIEYVAYGHFGNSHIHLNMLPLNQEQFVTAKQLYVEICSEALKLKGTFSAEHGVGKLKRDYLIKMYGENVVKEMAALKLSLDTNKILNIGNIFEEKYLQ